LAKNLTSYFLLLHFTVFLFGFTGILGRLISLSGDILVWYRTAFAMITLWIILLIRKTSFRLPLQQILQLVGIGVIVGAHWVTFFHAIKISNVSIALSCLAVTTLFVSIIEPLFFKRRIDKVDVLGGFGILLGLLLITNVQFNYWQGIVTGLISAMLSGLFTIMNRKMASHHDGFVISTYEMLGANLSTAIFILCTQPNLFQIELSLSDITYLLILGTICTAFAYWAIVHVLKRISAYAVVMSINLEPIYGTVLAALIFSEYEELNPGFYAGSAIILISVFVYSRYKLNLTHATESKK